MRFKSKGSGRLLSPLSQPPATLSPELVTGNTKPQRGKGAHLSRKHFKVGEAAGVLGVEGGHWHGRALGERRALP